MGYVTITADEGKIFRRKHDGFEMSTSIVLGVDYSTGTEREDKPEYYEQVDTPVQEEEEQL
jgi:hypothetical protein